MTAPTIADCRWCDKKIVFVWEKWQHFTKTEQRECPTPLPFEEQLPRVYKPIEYDEMPGDMVTAESAALIQQNLAMLIRRLVVRLRHDDKATKLCGQAMEYLRKTGLANPTDILRS